MASHVERPQVLLGRLFELYRETDGGLDHILVRLRLVLLSGSVCHTRFYCTVW